MPRGTNISEQFKVVPVLNPVSGCGTTTDIWNMENYSHATILIAQGSAGSAFTVTVRCVDDVSSSNSSAISFQYYSETTSGADILAARASAGAAGFTISSTPNQFHVLEVEASELSSGKPYMTVVFGEDVKNLVSCYAILSGSRFANDQSPTALA